MDSVHPRDLFSDRKLTFLWGSPECTHHSQARGGKPVNEQSRATAQCLVRWIRHAKPDHVIIENVPEFKSWGPCRQKVCKKTGKLLWIVQVVEGKKTKAKEVTVDFPTCLRQRRGEDRRDWLLRLSIAGYEMALTADKKKAGRRFKR